ncbi:MAG: FG-GAP-like repeat-containing protein [bacterium]|nr:FG-GAP-like repeat-containing protein [bacterium]
MHARRMNQEWPRIALSSIYALLLLVTLSLLETATAQDLIWERQVQGYLDGTYMAVYHGGIDYCKPVLVDIDGDGDGDLFVGEHDGYLDYFENLGGSPPNWLCVTTALDSIDVGKHCAPAFWDIDNDGDLDLFMGNEDGTIWFYRNTGTAHAPQWTFVTENYGQIMVDHHSTPFFRDVDADGDDDLLIGHNEGGAAFFMNVGQPGNPLWSNQGAFYNGFDVGDKSSVCVFDVNGDTLQDVFMGGLSGEITQFRNNGPPQAPTYIDMGSIFDAGHNSVPTFWDIDGDGDLDLISGTADGNLDLLTNTGNATTPRWELTQRYLGYYDASYYSNPTLADIDNDGDLDMFIGHVPGGISFLENVGTSDSAAWELVTETYNNINLPDQETPAFADIDNDGDLDLFVGSGDGTITFYQNDGTPQQPLWRAPVYNYADGVNVGSNSVPALGDVDADNDLDLFVGSYEGNMHFVRNDGTASNPIWQDLGLWPGIDVGNFAAPAFLDIDEDGDLDLLIGSGFLTGTISFYRNIGNPLLPSWTLVTSYYQGWDFGDNAVPCFGDLNGDSRPDLLVGCAAGGIYLMNNIGPVLDVQISLLPYNPPIVVPSTGGQIDYVIQLENNETQTLPMLAWTVLTYPDGQIFGTIDSLSIDLQPGVYNENKTLQIPPNFPTGIYTLKGYVGNSPELVYDTTSFQFEKQDTVEIVNPGNPESVAYNFEISSLFPNPFNSSTRIEYSLPQAGLVDVTLFDLTGRQIATLTHEWQDSGIHQLSFSPEGLAGGVYFLRLTSARHTDVRKLCYVR